MLINLNNEKEITVPCMNNGTGMMTAKCLWITVSKLFLAPFTKAVLS